MPELVEVMATKPSSHATARELADYYGVTIRPGPWVDYKLLPMPAR